MPLHLAAGFEQSRHKPAPNIGAIGPHPEQNYGRRCNQAARKYEITAIAVERYDPALLGFRQCEYLAVAQSPAAFKNRGNVIVPRHANIELTVRESSRLQTVAASCRRFGNGNIVLVL